MDIDAIQKAYLTGYLSEGGAIDILTEEYDTYDLAQFLLDAWTDKDGFRNTLADVKGYRK